MHQNTCTFQLTYAGSAELYRAVRAGFVSQGTTLNEWCIANGLNRQTVEKALKGDRVTKRGRILIERIVPAAFPKARGV